MSVLPRGWKGGVLLAAAVVLFPIAYTALLSGGARVESGDTPPSLVRGVSAPDFVLADLSGRPFTLSALRGKVVLVNFWATWCAPCRMELPSMEALYTRFAPRGFEMLAVNVDDESSDRVKSWVEKYHLSFPILKDGPDLPVSQAYGTSAIPVTFIVDKNGKIAEVVRGARKWDKKDVLTLMEELLKEPYSGGSPTATTTGGRPCAKC